jgi:peptidoglycan hydrolase CwlO-like protein
MNKKNLQKFVVVLIIISFLILGGASIFAQSSSEQEKTSLEKQLKDLEAKITEYERDVTKTQAQREALQYEVNTLKRRIEQLNVQIRQAQATAQSLAGQIKGKEESITVSISEINSLRQKLAGNLRAIHEEDQKSLIEILISEKDISGFFDNTLALERLSIENRNLLGKIVTLKINLEEEKITLGVAKEETEKVARMRAAQAQEVEAIRKTQESLLSDAQRKEATQKQELDDLERQAAEIRSRILKLIGTPSDVPRPSLGEALDIARWVQRETGVQPAFIVAIILQESALGRNVGQCYLVDNSSGKTRNINNGRIYNQGIATLTNHPRRNDLAHFINITRDLGRNSLQTPISCTMIINGAEFGYGGAMGPAQFIPTTWIAYKDEVSRRIGSSADPWRIKDSFLAAGLLLRDNGAAISELNAAARYFGSAGIGYESSVMVRRRCLQTFIDYGTMTSQCSRLIFVP